MAFVLFARYDSFVLVALNDDDVTLNRAHFDATCVVVRRVAFVRRVRFSPHQTVDRLRRPLRHAVRLPNFDRYDGRFTFVARRHNDPDYRNLTRLAARFVLFIASLPKSPTAYQYSVGLLVDRGRMTISLP